MYCWILVAVLHCYSGYLQWEPHSISNRWQGQSSIWNVERNGRERRVQIWNHWWIFNGNCDPGTTLIVVCLCELTCLIIINKKVLLRERKRHTAHCVASPYRGGTYLGCGGDTHLCQGVTYLGWGYLPWPGGTHLCRGYLPWLGLPTLAGVLPWVWKYKQTETITFPHPMDAGGNKGESYSIQY